VSAKGIQIVGFTVAEKEEYVRAVRKLHFNYRSILRAVNRLLVYPPMNVRAYMPSCSARDAMRAKTIEALVSTDWRQEPIVCREDPTWELPLHRHMALVRRTLELARRGGSELILLLEDDVVFNRHLRHNLESWHPVRSRRPGDHFFASLFNPGVRFVERKPGLAYGRALPESVYGAQALLISQETAHFLVSCWGAYPAVHADIKLARLAALVCPILFHMPSLVQHVGVQSLWGGRFLSADDYDAEWRMQ
jgi:hypothetical protein